MGLQTEFRIIICNLATGTDAIIGTDVLGSVLPHTLDIKRACYLRTVVLHSNFTGRIQLCPAGFLQ